MTKIKLQSIFLFLFFCFTSIFLNAQVPFFEGFPVKAVHINVGEDKTMARTILLKNETEFQEVFPKKSAKEYSIDFTKYDLLGEFCSKELLKKSDTICFRKKNISSAPKTQESEDRFFQFSPMFLMNLDKAVYHHTEIDHLDYYAWFLIPKKDKNQIDYEILSINNTKLFTADETIVIQNDAQYEKISEQKKLFNEKPDFTKYVIMGTIVISDCLATHDYEVVTNTVAKEVVFRIFEYDGGCAGMKSFEAWVKIPRQESDYAYQFEEIRRKKR